MSHVEIHRRTQIYFVNTPSLGTPEVRATINDVTVCASRGPPGIALSQWLAYWEGRR